MKPKILVIGDYCLDIIFTGLDSLPVLGEEIYAQESSITIGGGTFPTANVLRRLGADVDLSMQLGNDFYSNYALKLLGESEFDPDRQILEEQSIQRMTVALSYPEDRAFISIAEPSPKHINGDRFDESLIDGKAYDHLHIASLFAGIDSSELIKVARSRGMTVSMDCGWNMKAIHDPAAWDTISSVDIFLPNEKETLELTGETELNSAFEELARRIPLTVVKLGEEGSIAIMEGKHIAVSSITVEPVDTTAAGDCFNAGFLFGYLNEYSLDKCLLSGNICGAMSTTAAGWENAPSRDQLIDELRRNDHEAS